MKWILAILLFISAAAIGQTEDSTKYIWYKYQYGNRMPRFWADSGMHIPYGDTALFAKPQKPGFIMMHTDKLAYRWDGGKWASMGSGGGGSADSTIFAPNYRVDTAKVNLRNQIAAKLNISDTSTMLSPYLRKIDTTAKWVTRTYRKAGSDSVFYVKGGVSVFAYKDSIGTVSSGTVNPSKGCILGNSTIADYLSEHGIHYYLITKADSAAGSTITNNAIPGNTIAQQRAAWEGDANRALYDWIVVEVGLNDLDYTESAATALARYQRLVDTINAQKKTGAKILVSTMTPCKQRLIDLYGGTNGLVAYQKWLDMNNAISGGLPGKITGVDYRISNHTIALNDGTGNMLPVYDLGDGVHETNEARAIIASFWRNALNELGFLKVTQPTYFRQNPFFQSGDSVYTYNTNSSLLLGRRVNATVARPIAINLGGTVGTTAGDPWNSKVIIFDGGFGDSTLISGIGVSNARIEYHAAVAGSEHSFYVGGTKKPLVSISHTASGEGKLTLRAVAGSAATATPSLIDMGGTIADAFGDPSKSKIFLFSNAGTYAGIGIGYNGSSSQFEMHAYSNSSFEHYINSVRKFSITDTSLVAPQLQTTIDTANFKPVVINSSGFIKRLTSWPIGTGGGTDSAIWKNDGLMTGNHTLNGGGYSLTLGASGNKLSTFNTYTSGAATYNSNSHTFNDGSGHSFGMNSAGFFSIAGSLNLNVERATDANYSLTTSSCVLILPDISTGRTLSLPSTAREGMVYIVVDTNTTSNLWSFGGGGLLVDQTGTSVTTFANGVTYTIVGDNTANRYRIISAATKIPKVYNALLTQSGTSAPTATVLGTNTIGSIVWTRSSAGIYVGTLSSAFTSAKTWLMTGWSDESAGGNIVFKLKRTGNNTVELLTSQDGTNGSDVFTNLSIRIEVYP
jgi:hypothetical protein